MLHKPPAPVQDDRRDAPSRAPSAEGGGVRGRVIGRFGRCPACTVVEVKDDQIAGARVEATPTSATTGPARCPSWSAGSTPT